MNFSKENRADIAVHSLKDLPTIIDPSLVIGAIPRLQERNDIFIFSDNINSLGKLNIKI